MARSVILLTYGPGRYMPFIPDIFSYYSTIDIDVTKPLMSLYRDLCLSCGHAFSLDTDEQRREAIVKMKPVTDALRKTFGDGALAKNAFRLAYDAQDFDIGVIHGPLSAADIQAVRELCAQGGLMCEAWLVATETDVPPASGAVFPAVYRRTPKGYTPDTLIEFDRTFTGFDSYASEELAEKLRDAFVSFAEANSARTATAMTTVSAPEPSVPGSFMRVRRI